MSNYLIPGFSEKKKLKGHKDWSTWEHMALDVGCRKYADVKSLAEER